MKTSLFAACAFAAVLLSGCATDAPRTSLRPGGTYDPDARVRQAEMDSDRPMILVPYGMYGYPGPYYYGGGYGFGYGAYGYPAPWYGYGTGPGYLPPRHHHRSPPPPPTNGQAKPNNPPKTFRDLFPGAKH